MKKIIWGILILGILCSGCMNRDFEMDWEAIENMTMESNTTFVPETEIETEPEREKSPYYDVMMELAGTGEETYFYCVDIDHDEQNEVILKDENETIYMYLDYVDGNVVKQELLGVKEGLTLNRRGYFQDISKFEDKVIRAYVYDVLNNESIEFDRDECKHNGEPVSAEVITELLNNYGAGRASSYLLEKKEISEFAVLECSSYVESEFELFDFDKIKEVSEDANLMQKALLNEVKIYDTESGELKWFSDVFSGDTLFPPLYYCDLDGDGKEEAIVGEFGYSFFHEINGVIYRYEQPYSFMLYLFEDGSIESYSVTGEETLKIITEFTTEEIKYEHVYQVVDGVYYKEYSQDGDCVAYTEDELAQIKEQYKKVKKNYVIYDFDDVLRYIQ